MKFILPFILIISGVLFTVVGAAMFYRLWQFKNTAIRTTATVIKVKTGLSKAKNTTYSPVLSFTTVDGKEIIYDVDRYYFTNYTIGQKIEVIYPKDKPGAAQVNSFKQVFLPSAITIALGLLGLGIAIYLFIKK